MVCDSRGIDGGTALPDARESLTNTSAVRHCEFAAEPPASNQAAVLFDLTAREKRSARYSVVLEMGLVIATCCEALQMPRRCPSTGSG